MGSTGLGGNVPSISEKETLVHPPPCRQWNRCAHAPPSSSYSILMQQADACWQLWLKRPWPICLLAETSVADCPSAEISCLGVIHPSQPHLMSWTNSSDWVLCEESWEEAADSCHSNYLSHDGSSFSINLGWRVYFTLTYEKYVCASVICHQTLFFSSNIQYQPRHHSTNQPKNTSPSTIFNQSTNTSQSTILQTN